jgi:hypothetical protein
LLRFQEIGTLFCGGTRGVQCILVVCYHQDGMRFMQCAGFLCGLCAASLALVWCNAEAHCTKVAAARAAGGVTGGSGSARVATVGRYA